MWEAHRRCRCLPCQTAESDAPAHASTGRRCCQVERPADFRDISWRRQPERLGKACPIRLLTVGTDNNGGVPSLSLHPDRLLQPEGAARPIARRLYEAVRLVDDQQSLVFNL